ncbi:electron transfer flavoprotein-ubiquinone oxidoreductase [Litorimonas cladophorae]|uniref:Electron transfer flavoprotein-ubiquinone oxidoreductase n=1 Tax=Litorimonas cladophorae TaxID=1220491 RepID=A0A918ND70_9PROT|nr:electron transfer flavoprotein-ubiquinone oxidoreductase [Litorimonas cladophorae]GGX63906.1 electron transfer flavoprotein-ubiquinone oxidoreductase [Litorimonas cladophorae]
MYNLDHTSAAFTADDSTVERESMEYDVVIVGAGPAGLSAAIRLKQNNPETSVVVLEKGSEVGAHILSGAVLDPKGLRELFPDFATMDGCPVKTEVTADKFFVYGPAGALRIPEIVLPPLMHNHGNYIVSMANTCRWLAEQAEGLGVEIFPGMACSALVYCEDGSVKGVVAGEFGFQKDGTKGPGYEPGMELHGKYVMLGEGARGSLSKVAIAKYKLDEGAQPSKFGLGMKEIWDIDPAKHSEGTVVHSAGWPLGFKQGGGSFIYHAENNQVFLGMIVDLNYENPHMYPYMEFQKWKTHPDVKALLEGGKRVAYGARVVTKGGIQSVPQVAFPGGALLGCTAGLVNLPRIKGNHNAMLSGIHAADAATKALAAGRSGDTLTEYDDMLHDGPIGEDLRPVRNVAPLNGRFGPFLGGMLMGGVDMWSASLLKFNPLGTMKHKKDDAGATNTVNKMKRSYKSLWLKSVPAFAPIEYPKPDGVLTFDRLTNVSFTATNHGEDQPSHLRLINESVPITVNLPLYDEPSVRYCPAGVYEVLTDDDGSNPRFNINAQNCIHCKTCDIKDPSRNIVWTVPEGGGGPNYPNM